MNIFKKISFANRTLSVIEGLKDIARRNAAHADGVKEGINLIKQGAEKIVKEIHYLKPFYNELTELLKNV